MSQNQRRVVKRDPDQMTVASTPWVQELLHNTIETTTINVLRYCTFIIKIGEDSLESKTYIKSFQRRIERCYDDLLFDLEIVHDLTLDKVMRNLQQIEDVCKDLRLEIPDFEFEGVPLDELRKTLSECYTEYEIKAKGYRKSFEELQKRMEQACRSMGRIPNYQTSSMPLVQEVERLREHVQELESERFEREEEFFRHKEEIIKAAMDMEIQPKTDFEKQLFSLDRSVSIITDDYLNQLGVIHNEMLTQRDELSKKIDGCRTRLEELWDILDLGVEERNGLRHMHGGTSVTTLEHLENELQRFNYLTIEKKSRELELLWDKCYISTEDKITCLEIDLLEAEINKWREVYEENKEIFTTVEKIEKTWTMLCNVWETKNQTLNETKRHDEFIKRITKLEDKLWSLTKGRNQSIDKTVINYVKKLRTENDKKSRIKFKKSKLYQESQINRTNEMRSKDKLTIPQKNTKKDLSATRTVKVPTFSLAKGRRLAASRKSNTSISHVSLSSTHNSKNNSGSSEEEENYSQFEKEMNKAKRCETRSTKRLQSYHENEQTQGITTTDFEIKN